MMPRTVSGFSVAVILTWIYPDDIAGLGGLTAGIVGMAVNLVVFLSVSAITGRTDADRRRVDTLFEAGRSPVRVRQDGALRAS